MDGGSIQAVRRGFDGRRPGRVPECRRVAWSRCSAPGHASASLWSAAACGRLALQEARLLPRRQASGHRRKDLRLGAGHAGRAGPPGAVAASRCGPPAGRREYLPVGLTAASLLPTPAGDRTGTPLDPRTPGRKSGPTPSAPDRNAPALTPTMDPLPRLRGRGEIRRSSRPDPGQPGARTGLRRHPLPRRCRPLCRATAPRARGCRRCPPAPCRPR